MSIKDIYRSIVLHRWELAFVENGMESILAGDPIRIKQVKYPFKGRWFADPFILDYDAEKIVLLVEDYSDADKKGKISRLTINRKTMQLEDVKVILELDSHLSFPAIIRKDGRIFIYPENSEGNGLWLYEYHLETDECIKVAQLSDQPLTDAIYTEYFGKKQIFSTKEPDANKNILGIYNQDEGTKQYQPSESIVFDENIARNAGDFFVYEGCLYRPAQECNQMYGHAVSIQKIMLGETSYQFKEIQRMMPPKGSIGIHTFNTYNGLTVVDLKVFRHPCVANLLFKFRNLFKQGKEKC